MNLPNFPATEDFERWRDDSLGWKEWRSLQFEYPYRPGPRAKNRRIEAMLVARDDAFAEVLRTFLPFSPYFSAISPTAAKRKASGSPFWQNDWLPPLDAMSIYSLIATLKPDRYIEVGSGMSTTFARQAIVDHKLDTKIISIDPSPRAEIDALCDFVVRSCCEDVDPAFFASMTSRDLLFVDNSHRSFQNSDVTVFFTEILPSLPAGCTYGLHDIFLPLDYPREWVDRFYNEQYLLAAYLLGGAGGDQIVLANGHVESQSHLCSLLDPLWLLDPICGRQRGGGAFWMRRGTVGNV